MCSRGDSYWEVKWQWEGRLKVMFNVVEDRCEVIIGAGRLYK